MIKPDGRIKNMAIALSIVCSGWVNLYLKAGGDKRRERVVPLARDLTHFASMQAAV